MRLDWELSFYRSVWNQLSQIQLNELYLRKFYSGVWFIFELATTSIQNMLRLSRKGLLYLALTDVILYLFLPLEIYDVSSRYIVYTLIWISFFIFFLNLFPSQNSFGKTILPVIGTIIYVLITLLFAFVFFLFCGWHNYGAMYQNKKHDSVKIICKTYDCYGTAEGCRLFKQQQILPHVYWVTKFKDKEVDTNVWERIPKNKINSCYQIRHLRKPLLLPSSCLHSAATLPSTLR